MHVIRMGYPVILNLAGRSVLIVGAGAVCERKLRGLIGQGARIAIVAPEFDDAVKKAAEAAGAEVRVREFRADDLEGVFLAHACASDPSVNEAVLAEGESRGILVCRADRGGEGHFTTPASFSRGSLQVSLSTSGLSPTLASVLLERIESALAPELEGWAELFGLLRVRVQEIPDPRDRRAAVGAVMDDPDVACAVRSGNLAEARATAERLLGSRRT